MKLLTKTDAKTFGEWLKSTAARGLNENECRLYQGSTQEECVRALPQLIQMLQTESNLPPPFEGILVQTGAASWMIVVYSTTALN